MTANAAALREAATAHHDAERRLPPHDWATWYASFLNARHLGSTVERAAALADVTATQ